MQPIVPYGQRLLEFQRQHGLSDPPAARQEVPVDPDSCLATMRVATPAGPPPRAATWDELPDHLRVQAPSWVRFPATRSSSRARAIRNAYARGFDTGINGAPRASCPHPHTALNRDLVVAWEAGFDRGAGRR